MIEKVYKDFLRESHYSKAILNSVISYVLYIATAIVTFFLFLAAKKYRFINLNEYILLIVSICIGAVLSITVSLLYAFFKLGNIQPKEKIALVLRGQNLKEFETYCQTYDNELIRKILINNRLNTSEQISYLIEKYEKNNFHGSDHKISIITIMSIFIALISYIETNENSSISTKITYIASCLLISLIVINFKKIVRKSSIFNFLLKGNKEYFITILIDYYLETKVCVIKRKNKKKYLK